MEIKINAPLGTVFPIGVYEKNFFLKTQDAWIDISENLTKDERITIQHVGAALAVSDGKGGINICRYFNYHVHSKYSILDGMNEVKTLAHLSSGVSAISEHGNMFSFLEWQKACEKEGKKAVFAFEAYVESVNGAISEKGLDKVLEEETEGVKEGCHLILIAKSDEGLKNLFELSTLAYSNFYRKPHVSIEALKKHNKDIACTSACLSGEIARLLSADDYEGAKNVASFYKSVFGNDFYLEIQRHNIPIEDKVNPMIIKLSKELNIKLLAANDSHWTHPEDEKAHDYLLCVRNKASMKKSDHPTFDGDGYEYFSDTDMINRFWDLPEAIKNGLKLASECTAHVETGNYHVPAFPLPEGFSSEEEYLLELALKGFKNRYGEGTDELKERLDYELSVITEMGYSGYFLIVADYVNWAKSQGIAVGPGRGSAVGSVLAYSLGITDLEPTKYGLMFERFLNPERVSMPDIDIDFDFERRQDVIEYVKYKYGEECVCNIITFGTMAAKNAVKDVARCNDDYRLGDEISKMIKADKLSDALKEPELENAYNTRAEVKDVIDTALHLEGMPRNTSVHACGVVISDKPIKNYMPMAMVKDTKAEDKGLPKDTKMLCTQVTMTEVEELGCLKMDFLGLRTMTLIRKALEYINADREKLGQVKIENYRDLPLNNPYSYIDISEGKTQALFQIESEGMRSLMRSLFWDVKERISEIEATYNLGGFGKSLYGDGQDRDGYNEAMRNFGDELFERMIAAISLYRPGPMDYIPDYEKGLKDSTSITYDTPELEPILRNTYGVMVYQEQVMQTVKALAGFSNAQADTIRKAMGKKKQAILDEYKPYFLYGSGDAIDEHTKKPLNIKGCAANGVSDEVASAVWDKMKDFAKYAFNKSHAAGYAVITITCAWLKKFYPVHFMCAALNSYIDKNDKLAAYLSVTGKMGIKILPPSVNKSEAEFTVENGAIRFGMKGLKGLSKGVSEIIENRNKYGYFSSVENYAERVPKAAKIDAMAKAGCFDEFGHSRQAIVESLKDIKDSIKRKSKETEGQMSLLETLGIVDEYEIPDLPEWDKDVLLSYEKEVTGLYISEHPLDTYKDALENCSDISDLEPGNVTVGCLISDYSIKYTKRDSRPMASITLEDKTGDIKGVLFPDDYDAMFGNLNKDKVVIIKGEYREDDDFGKQIVVKSIIDIQDIVSQSDISKIYVNLEHFSQLDMLDRVLNEYSGSVEVIAQCECKTYIMNKTANPCSALYMRLKNEFAGVVYK